MIQLQKQAGLLKDLLKQRSNSPPTPSKTAVDQITKSAYLSMHSAILLFQEIATLRRANEKKRQKRTRSNRQIAHQGGLTIAEGLQLAQQPEQLVEGNQVVSVKAAQTAVEYSGRPQRVGYLLRRQIRREDGELDQ